MKITLSGPIGSGKSTVGILLARKLHIEFISGGEIFRQNARKHNMTLAEFGKYAESNPEIDKQQDQFLLQLLVTRENLVLESRLAGWIATKNAINATRIYIDADIDVRIERVMKREGGTRDNVLKTVKEREDSELKRYMKYYGVDYRIPEYYDIIVDTTKISAEEGADIIYAGINHTC
jgi:predicted cytidylate kinase